MVMVACSNHGMAAHRAAVASRAPSIKPYCKTYEADVGTSSVLNSQLMHSSTELMAISLVIIISPKLKCALSRHSSFCLRTMDWQSVHRLAGLQRGDYI